jgi:hypothetical protein
VAATWAEYDALTRARDDAARRRFSLPAIELLHRLHGSHSEPTRTNPDGQLRAVEGWHVRDHEIDAQAIDAAWAAIAARTGARGTVRIERANVRPRAFVVEPGVEVIVVVPLQIDTPAARFAVLHELGHAACGLVSKLPVPRVLDEAVASRIARLMENGQGVIVIGDAWTSPLAAEARGRRIALAALLDRRERGPIDTGQVTPPWALWHDPGAQAAYVAAEAIADRLPLEGLAAAVSRERVRIDLATTL